MTVSWGVLPSGHPYHRFGHGDQPLVVVPGVMDSLGWNTPGAATGHLLARHHFRPLRRYDVWVVSRPPGLPADATIQSLASGYAAATATIGPSHLLGFSLGGTIAAHLAAMCPQRVKRLVLACVGDRLGPYGGTVLERWQECAAAGEWDQLQVEYNRVVYAGWRRLVLPPLYRLGRPLLPTPQAPGDVVRSCALARTHDGDEVLQAVGVPTLVIGGESDSLYPTPRRRRCARLVGNGSVATLPGGHAVYDEHRDRFCETVHQFLARE